MHFIKCELEGFDFFFYYYFLHLHLEGHLWCLCGLDKIILMFV